MLEGLLTLRLRSKRPSNAQTSTVKGTQPALAVPTCIGTAECETTREGWGENRSAEFSETRMFARHKTQTLPIIRKRVIMIQKQPKAAQ